MSMTYIVREGFEDLHVKCPICGDINFSNNDVYIKTIEDYDGKYEEVRHQSLECWECGHVMLFKGTQLHITR